MAGEQNQRYGTSLKADITQKPISVTNVTEAGCMGVAMLAAAAGANKDVLQIAGSWIKKVSVLEPGNSETYDKKFKSYKQLYKTISGIQTAG